MWAKSSSTQLGEYVLRGRNSLMVEISGLQCTVVAEICCNGCVLMFGEKKFFEDFEIFWLSLFVDSFVL